MKGVAIWPGLMGRWPPMDCPPISGRVTATEIPGRRRARLPRRLAAWRAIEQKPPDPQGRHPRTRPGARAPGAPGTHRGLKQSLSGRRSHTVWLLRPRDSPAPSSGPPAPSYEAGHRDRAGRRRATGSSATTGPSQKEPQSPGPSRPPPRGDRAAAPSRAPGPSRHPPTAPPPDPAATRCLAHSSAWGRPSCAVPGSPSGDAQRADAPQPQGPVKADTGERRIRAITEDIMFKWRLLLEDGRKAGHTFSQPDLIIAATALHHGLTVVSRDVSDYQKARPCLTPWVDPLPAGSPVSATPCLPVIRGRRTGPAQRRGDTTPQPWQRGCSGFM
jgi:hypothetical protein